MAAEAVVKYAVVSTVTMVIGAVGGVQVNNWFDTRERVVVLESRIDDLANDVQKLEEKFDARLDKLEEKFDAKFDKLEEKFDAKFDKLDGKIDKLLAQSAADE